MTTERTSVATAVASVVTKQVEIRTLAIGGKKMSRAVFDQLERLWPFDGDAFTPAGEIWGYVNLHAEGCPYGDHLHLVWSSSGRVATYAVSATPPNSALSELVGEIDTLLKHYADIAHRHDYDRLKKEREEYVARNAEFVEKHPSAGPPLPSAELLAATVQKEIDALLLGTRRAVDRVQAPFRREQAEAARAHAIRRIEVRRAAWATTWEKCLAAGQLFIGV